MRKKILIVDDSALMRRMLCDIISSDERFEVTNMAVNGEEALSLVLKTEYDTIILDHNMPKMTGLELLKKLKEQDIPAKVVMVSSVTKEGAEVTLEALELGAVDFAQKPASILDTRAEEYRERLLKMLEETTTMPMPRRKFSLKREKKMAPPKVEVSSFARTAGNGKSKLVAIACSTGGPKSLQSVVPKLPKNLDAPVVIVQHMPKGFTESLAERLDNLSELTVCEAKEGDVLEKGHVYIAKGGSHLKLRKKGNETIVFYTDEPTREGVKPCANYMYESIIDTDYTDITCVVMTGMGADGTEGIQNLEKEKRKKNITVFAQEESTCVVYGMPRAVVNAGLADKIIPLEQIAKEIITNTGVQ